ncbi:hypothetical protein CERSUDRAFT_90034 [Gelatoporia subvermispora B]|uniref:Uncharacterized protein n=1 Tax=Ceriporiopsis subvermispora (strain B) TaxID=914234 RepID=M2RSQ4_CERS8|nr:hypothetical protein CERSUDRAFT_90034 [Gelatoporia subvermispora B]
MAEAETPQSTPQAGRKKLSEEEALEWCRQDALKEGIYAGLSAGLVSAILGSKLFRFNRNTTILCGVVTGVLSGYQFTQGFYASNVARLRAEQRQLEMQEQSQEQSAPSEQK